MDPPRDGDGTRMGNIDEPQHSKSGPGRPHATIENDVQQPEGSDSETTPPYDEHTRPLNPAIARYDWREPFRRPTVDRRDDVNHWTHPDHPDHPRRGEYARTAEMLRNVEKDAEAMMAGFSAKFAEGQAARRELISELEKLKATLIAKKEAAKEKRLAEEKAKEEEEKPVAEEQAKGGGKDIQDNDS